MTRFSRTARKGFTLIEILIVVIILGILAAIVIPQFTDASTSARRASLTSQLQTLRSQIELFKLQHNDMLPGDNGSGTFDGAAFWTHMTTQTDVDGAAYVSGTSTTGPFGPYLQAESRNPMVEGTAASTVVDGDDTDTPTATDGFLYDFTGGTGKIWAVEKTGASTYAIFNESGA